MKKESLSIITVKILLAVIIFTGVGTIIIGGGWLIGNNKKVSELVKKNVVESEVKDETADWKTYQNEKYGYSFEYPSNCFYGSMPRYCKQKPPEEQPLECLCFLDGEDQDEVFIITFTNRKKSKFTLASFSIHHDIFADPLLYKNVQDKPNMKIDGIDAVKAYTPFSGLEYSREDIYFIRNDRLLNIEMMDVDNMENKKLYNQILSSFKFIEK